jgi:hypothetical protein
MGLWTMDGRCGLLSDLIYPQPVIPDKRSADPGPPRICAPIQRGPRSPLRCGGDDKLWEIVSVIGDFLGDIRRERIAVG